MRTGFVDIFTSRRTMFDKCQFWKRNEDDYVDTNEIVYSIEPSGYFSAQQVSGEENSPQVIGGIYMFDSNRVTIKTNDDIEIIKKNDVVLFREEGWRVENVQKIPVKKVNQYCSEIYYTFYLRLKK